MIDIGLEYSRSNTAKVLHALPFADADRGLLETGKYIRAMDAEIERLESALSKAQGQDNE